MSSGFVSLLRMRDITLRRFSGGNFKLQTRNFKSGEAEGLGQKACEQIGNWDAYAISGE